MKGLVFAQNGEPNDVLTWDDLPDPTPGPGEILVRILLAPAHPSDLHIIRGRFGRKPSLPTSPGVECVGVVEACGQGVSEPKPGTRVVLIDVWSTWRERVVCKAERAVAVPVGVTDEDAAQAIVNPVTAWVMTMVEHRMQPGEWLAQTAAGSTVGRLVLQIARSEGFRTLNIVRRPEQVNEIKALGGTATVSTDREDWTDQLASLIGEMPAKAIDCVSGATGAALVRALAPGGRMLLYGALSSHRQTDPRAFELPVFGPRLIYSAATVQGWYLFHWLVVTPLTTSAAIVKEVLNRLASGALKLPPAERHSPADPVEALRAAESTNRTGKPLLDFTKI
jgi:NADPH:quinone reductase-like Zn-dependent oxidoreductase